MIYSLAVYHYEFLTTWSSEVFIASSEYILKVSKALSENSKRRCFFQRLNDDVAYWDYFNNNHSKAVFLISFKINKNYPLRLCLPLLCKIKSSQVKYRLLHGRLERLGMPQLTQPQLRPITWRGITIWKKKRLKWISEQRRVVRQMKLVFTNYKYSYKRIL